MEQGNIFLEVLLRFFMYPLLKVNEIKRMRVLYAFYLQPFNKKWKIISNLLSIEYSVYHMTAKKSHFYLVSYMRINILVLVDVFEYIRCC